VSKVRKVSKGLKGRENNAACKKIEDLLAWQGAKLLIQMVYKITRAGALSKDFGLRDQLQRAAVSGMANIAEGFDCESRPEFARFLAIARRSAVEVQSLLYAALDLGYMNQTTFEEIYDQDYKTKGLINGLKRSLKIPPK
jgi:four helix bundle protein